MQAPIAVTIPEAVNLTGMSRTALYEAMKRDLPAKKSGRRTLIMMTALKAYLADLPDYCEPMP